MIVTVVEAKKNLGDLIEQVNLDRSAVEIVSERSSGVLIARDEYDELIETGYLLSSPKNAQRLLSALGSAPKRRQTTAP